MAFEQDKERSMWGDAEKWSEIKAAMTTFVSAQRIEGDGPNGRILLIAAGSELPIDRAEELGLVPAGTAEEMTVAAVRRAYAKARGE